MLIRILTTILVNAAALFATAFILPGFSVEGGAFAYLIAALVIILLNAILKPILKFLSFPIVFITGGLFLIVINAAIIYFAQYLIGIMDITGVALHVFDLLTYLLAAIIFGLANWFIHWFLKD